MAAPFVRFGVAACVVGHVSLVTLTRSVAPGTRCIEPLRSGGAVTFASWRTCAHASRCITSHVAEQAWKTREGDDGVGEGGGLDATAPPGRNGNDGGRVKAGACDWH